MENKVINKKSETVNVLKIFKELLTLHSDKIKDLSSYESYFKNIEEDIGDEDENDLDHLKNTLFNLAQEFKTFLIEYNIKYTPTINISKEPTISILKE